MQTAVRRLASGCVIPRWQSWCRRQLRLLVALVPRGAVPVAARYWQHALHESTLGATPSIQPLPVRLQDGSMRCDVNVSVRPAGQEQLGTKVEVKNMNSFSGMTKAIDFEVERQVRLVLRYTRYT